MNKLTHIASSTELAAALLLMSMFHGGCGRSNLHPHAPSPPTEGFVVVVLPDSQCYMSGGDPPGMTGVCGGGLKPAPEMMYAQMEWIAESLKSHKISAVAGVGDTVNCAQDAVEWSRAETGYHLLDLTGVPYSTVLGNHDYDQSCMGSIGSRGSLKFNEHFGPARFANHNWYGESTYPVTTNDNSYVKFDAAQGKFLLLDLEFFPRNEAIDWAKAVIAENMDRQVLIVTHGYMSVKGIRKSSDSFLGPAAYGLRDSNDGEDLWDKLVSRYPNILAVVCGHAGGGDASGATATRVDQGINGNLVPQMLANYQWNMGGGAGYLRILNIQPAKHRIVVSTYSPYLDRTLADGGNEFAVSYGLQ